MIIALTVLKIMYKGFIEEWLELIYNPNMKVSSFEIKIVIIMYIYTI